MPRWTPSNSLIIAVSAITILTLTACSGPSAEARLAKASQEIKAKNNRAALINLRSLIKQHPNNAKGHLLLGSLLFKLGDPGIAASQLQQANRLKPIPIDAQFQLVQSLIQIDKLDNAAKELDAMKVISPVDKAERLAFEGEIALGKKQTNNATKLFTTALTLNPHSHMALVGQGIVALISSEPDVALRKADAALKISPDSASAWMVKGYAVFEKHEVQDAVTYLEKALKYGPPGLSPSEIFQTRGHLAQAELALGQREKALGNVNAMLMQAPKNPFPNYLRGLIDYENKNYSSAAQYFQIALNFNPYNVNALTLLASAEAKQGQNVLAMNHLSGVLAQDPQNPFAKHLMATLQFKSGEEERAIQTIVGNGGNDTNTNRILSLFSSPNAAIKTLTAMQANHKSSSSGDAIKLALAQALIIGGKQHQALTVLHEVRGGSNTHLNQERLKAIAYLQAHEPAKATAVAHQIVSEDAHDSKALTLAAVIYAATNEDKQSVRVLKKAHALKPEDVRVTNLLATLALKMGHIDKANDYYHSTLSHDAKNLDAMMSLARISAIRGDRNDAIHWLQQAKTDHPMAPEPLVALAQYHLDIKQPSRALDDIQQAVTLVPDNAKVLSILAKIQLANGKKEAALQTFQNVVESHPDVPYYGMQLAAMQTILKQTKATQTTLESITAKFPDYYPAFRALAMSQWHTGDKQGAFATAAKINHGNQGKVQSEILTGDLDLLNKHYGAALKNYRLVYDKLPSRDLIPRIYTAETKGHLGKPDTTLLTWLKTHPNDAAIRNVLALYYLKSSQLKAAETQYRRVLQQAPDNPEVLNNLAWLISQSNPQLALPYAQKAHNLVPQSTQISDTLGWILIQLKEPDKALPLLRIASEGTTSQPTTRYHYAVALSELHHDGKALIILKSLLNNFPKFSERTKAESLYKKLHGT